MGDGRTEKVTFTCTPEMKEFLSLWAAKERRSVSNLVEGLIAEAMEQIQKEQTPPLATATGEGKSEEGRSKKPRG